VSGKYDAGRRGYARGQVDWERAPIEAVLTDASYSFSRRHATGDIKTLGKPIAVPDRRVDDEGYVRCGALVFRGVKSGSTNGVAFYVAGERGVPLFHVDDIESFPMAANGAAIEIDWRGEPITRI
jgi:hypothetical protein